MATKTPAKRAAKAAAPAPAAKAPGPLTDSGIKLAIDALGKGAYDAFVEVRDMYRDFKSQLIDHEQTKLAFYYALGQRFVAVEETWHKKGFAQFGRCLALQDNEIESARMAMRMARRWTTEEITEMVDRARESGGNIEWSHVRILAALPEQEYAKYVEVVTNERMGYQGLIAKITADRAARADGEKPKVQGGRKFNIPQGFAKIHETSVRQIVPVSRFHEQLGNNLTAAIEEIEEDKYDAALLTRVRAMREQYDTLFAAISNPRDELVAFERRVEQALEARSLEAEVGDDEEADEDLPADDPPADEADDIDEAGEDEDDLDAVDDGDEPDDDQLEAAAAAPPPTRRPPSGARPRP